MPLCVPPDARTTVLVASTGSVHRQEPGRVGACSGRKQLLIDDAHRLEVDDVERAAGGSPRPVRDDRIASVRRHRKPERRGADDDAGPNGSHDSPGRQHRVERVARRQLAGRPEAGRRGEGDVRDEVGRPFGRAGRRRGGDGRKNERGAKQEAPQAAPGGRCVQGPSIGREGPVRLRSPDHADLSKQTGPRATGRARGPAGISPPPPGPPPSPRTTSAGRPARSASDTRRRPASRGRPRGRTRRRQRPSTA